MEISRLQTLGHAPYLNLTLCSTQIPCVRDCRGQIFFFFCGKLLGSAKSRFVDFVDETLWPYPCSNSVVVLKNCKRLTVLPSLLDLALVSVKAESWRFLSLCNICTSDFEFSNLIGRKGVAAARQNRSLIVTMRSFVIIDA